MAPKNIRVPPPPPSHPSSVPPPQPQLQQKMEPAKLNSTPPPPPPLVSDKATDIHAFPMQMDGFVSALDPTTFKDKFLDFMSKPRDDFVTKEQAKLDKLEMMLMNLNNAIHSKASQPQPQPQAQLQQLMANNNGGSLNGQYRTQPGLECAPFKSVKKRKAESQLEKDETEELLKRKVAEEEVKFRDGGGRPVAYIDNYTATKNAVEVLGYDGWSDFIVNSSVLVASVDGDKYSFEVVVLMRMYLENGSFREDYGFGKATKTSKGESLVSALKAAATMARKRLWRLCGEYMGNSLYDKNYVEEVNKRRKLMSAKK